MKRETIHIYRYTEERADKQERLVLGGGGGGAARNNRDEWRRPREGGGLWWSGSGVENPRGSAGGRVNGKNYRF